MGTYQEIFEKFENLDSSNPPSFTAPCVTDELDWSLNLNDFELSLIRDILSNGGTPDNQTIVVFSDISTIPPQNQSKSPEIITNFPDMDGALPAVSDAIEVTLNEDFTAGQCDEVVSGGKEHRPLPLVKEAFHPSLPGRRYRGVRQNGGKFTAKINIKNPEKRYKHLWLGTYNTAEEAAMAFDRAAFKHRGSCVVLNFPSLIGTYDESPETVPPRKGRRSPRVPRRLHHRKLNQ